MATTTPRIGLTKPDGTDLVDIAVLNTNFDKIDSNIASTKIQSTKPTTANAGDLWWDSDTGTLYLYYTDANSSQWVAATSDPINIGVVANQTERDAQYPTPAQGMSVYRTDLGVTQRYYGLFNKDTNPGGRDTAGWYDTEKSQGFVPIQPTTVTIATGTGSANAMGAVTFTGATTVSVDGVFTSRFRNYRIVITGSNTTNDQVKFKYRTGGTDTAASSYNYEVLSAASGSVASALVANNASSRIVYTTASTQFNILLDVINPQTSIPTTYTCTSSSGSGYSSALELDGGDFSSTASFDGISILPQSGNMTGTMTVYGYNN